MDSLTIKRVQELPTVFTPSTVYIAKSPDNPELVDLVFVGNDALEIRRAVGIPDVQSEIEKALRDWVPQRSFNADRFTEPFTFTLTGDVTGSVNITGDVDVNIVTKVTSAGSDDTVWWHFGTDPLVAGDATEHFNDNSIVIGHAARSSAVTAPSISIGPLADSSGDYGISIGDTAKSSLQSIGLGRNSWGEGLNAIALGTYSWAWDGAISIGANSSADGADSVAIGQGAVTNNVGSIALGVEAFTRGNCSMALGRWAYTGDTGHYATAVGHEANALGGYSLAVGFQAYSNSVNSTAMGYKADATGLSSIALGSETFSNGENSTALGFQTQANGRRSTAIGYLSRADGIQSLAVGNEAEANGNYSIAIGGIIASGRDTITIGDGSEIYEQYEEPIGIDGTVSIGAGGYITGHDNTAIGNSIFIDVGSYTSNGSTSATGESVAIGAFIMQYENVNCGTTVGAYSGNYASYSVALGAYTRSEVEYQLATHTHHIIPRPTDSRGTPGAGESKVTSTITSPGSVSTSATYYCELGVADPWVTGVFYVDGTVIQQGSLQYVSVCDIINTSYREGELLGTVSRDLPQWKTAANTFTTSFNKSGRSSWYSIDIAAGLNLAVPPGMIFYPDEVGFLCFGHRDVIAQPFVSIGTAANPTLLVANQQLSTIDGPNQRHTFVTNGKHGITDLRFKLNTAATGTNPKFNGRFYAKGIFIQAQGR